MQDEEQLKLIAQQVCLLKRQLGDWQGQAAGAKKQVQDEQSQLQRLERRMATLQAHSQEQQAHIRCPSNAN